jgi:hypothetical protein
MRMYLANKMAGLPEFNFPWFDAAAASLRSIPLVTDVFNPAEEDRKYGFDAKGLAGNEDEAIARGFDRRRTLGLDWAWIAANSDGCVVGPDWPRSMGTKSEIACHQALGLPVWAFGDFMKYWNTSCLSDYVLPELITLGHILVT